MAAGDPRIQMRRARTKRWIFIGLLAVGTAAFYFVGRPPVIPVGVVMPNLIAGAMSTADANGILNTVARTGQVEVRATDVTVKITAATFPERREGQLALAQQYTRADEIVLGHKRAINFIDPNGTSFAKADPAKGVMMTR